MTSRDGSLTNVKQYCNKCGSNNLKEIPRPDTIHFAEIRCGGCNSWIS